MIKIEKKEVLKINFRNGAKISGQWEHFRIHFWLPFVRWEKVVFLQKILMKYFNKFFSMYLSSRFICCITIYWETCDHSNSWLTKIKIVTKQKHAHIHRDIKFCEKILKPTFHCLVALVGVFVYLCIFLLSRYSSD